MILPALSRCLSTTYAVLILFTFTTIHGSSKGDKQVTWYTGCYERIDGQRQYVYPPQPLTPAGCSRFCLEDQGYVYAMLKASTDCICITSLSGFRKVSDDQCNVRCFQDQSSWCGGMETYSVYSTTGPYISKVKGLASPKTVVAGQVVTIHVKVQIASRSNFPTGLNRYQNIRFDRINITVSAETLFSHQVVEIEDRIAYLVVEHAFPYPKFYDIKILAQNPVSHQIDKVYLPVLGRIPGGLLVSDVAYHKLYPSCTPGYYLATSYSVLSLESTSVVVGESVLLEATLRDGFNLTFEWTFCDSTKRVVTPHLVDAACENKICLSNVQEFVLNEPGLCEVNVKVFNAFGSVSTVTHIVVVAPEIRDLSIRIGDCSKKCALSMPNPYEFVAPKFLDLFPSAPIPLWLNDSIASTQLSPVTSTNQHPTPYLPPGTFLENTRVCFHAAVYMSLRYKVNASITFGDGDSTSFSLSDIVYGYGADVFKFKPMFENGPGYLTNKESGPRNLDGSQKPRKNVSICYEGECMLSVYFSHIYTKPGIYHVHMQVANSSLTISSQLNNLITIIPKRTFYYLTCEKIVATKNFTEIAIPTEYQEDPGTIHSWMISKHVGGSKYKAYSSQWQPHDNVTHTSPFRHAFHSYGIYKVQVNSSGINDYASPYCVIRVEDPIGSAIFNIRPGIRYVDTGETIHAELSIEKGSNFSISWQFENDTVLDDQRYSSPLKLSRNFSLSFLGCRVIKMVLQNDVNSVEVIGKKPLCREEKISGLLLIAPENLTIGDSANLTAVLSSGSHVTLTVEIFCNGGAYLFTSRKEILSVQGSTSFSFTTPAFFEPGKFKIVLRAKNHVTTRKLNGFGLMRERHLVVKSEISDVVIKHVPVIQPSPAINREDILITLINETIETSGGLLYKWICKKNKIKTIETSKYTVSPISKLIPECSTYFSNNQSGCDVSVTVLSGITQVHAILNITSDLLHQRNQELNVRHPWIVTLLDNVSIKVDCFSNITEKFFCKVFFSDIDSFVNISSNTTGTIDHTFSTPGLWEIKAEVLGSLNPEYSVVSFVSVQEKISHLQIEGDTILLLNETPFGQWQATTRKGNNLVFEWTILRHNTSHIVTTLTSVSCISEIGHHFEKPGFYDVIVVAYNDVSSLRVSKLVEVRNFSIFFNVKADFANIGMDSLFVLKTNLTRPFDVYIAWSEHENITSYTHNQLNIIGDSAGSKHVIEYSISHKYKKEGMHRFLFVLQWEAHGKLIKREFAGLASVFNGTVNKPVLITVYRNKETIPLIPPYYALSGDLIRGEIWTSGAFISLNWSVASNDDVLEKKVFFTENPVRFQFFANKSGNYFCAVTANPGNIKAFLTIIAFNPISRFNLYPPYSTTTKKSSNFCELRPNKDGKLQCSAVFQIKSTGENIIFYFSFLQVFPNSTEQKAVTFPVKAVLNDDSTDYNSVAKIEHTFTKEGAYNVSVRGFLINGNSESNNIPLLITSLKTLFYAETVPVVSLSTGHFNVEAGKSTTFTLNQKNPNQTLNANWNMGDTTQRQGLQVNHTYVESGTYRMRITVYNRARAVYLTPTVRVNRRLKKVILTITPQGIVPVFQTVLLKATTTPPNAASIYTWYLEHDKPASTSYVGKKFYRFMKRREYLVKVVATNGISKVESVIKSVKVEQRIVGLRIVGPDVVTVDEISRFKASYAGGDVHIEWKIGNETILRNKEVVEHEFNKLGIYKVTLVATNPLGRVSVGKEVFVMKSFCFLPRVSFPWNQHGEYDMSQSLCFEAILDFQCPQVRAVKYSWIVAHPWWRIPPFAIEHNQLLQIPPNSLRPQLYSIKLNTALAGTVLSANAARNITVTRSKPVAIISGGFTRTFARSKNITLDATRTYDPNRLKWNNLWFSWECFILKSPNKFCFKNVTDQRNLTKKTNNREYRHFKSSNDASTSGFPADFNSDSNILSFPAKMLVDDSDTFIFRVNVSNDIYPGMHDLAMVIVKVSESDNVLNLQLDCPLCLGSTTIQHFATLFRVTCTNCNEAYLEYEWSISLIDDNSNFEQQKVTDCPPRNRAEDVWWLKGKSPTNVEKSSNQSIHGSNNTFQSSNASTNGSYNSTQNPDAELFYDNTSSTANLSLQRYTTNAKQEYFATTKLPDDSLDPDLVPFDHQQPNSFITWGLYHEALIEESSSDFMHEVQQADLSNTWLASNRQHQQSTHRYHVGSIHTNPHVKEQNFDIVYHSTEDSSRKIRNHYQDVKHTKLNTSAIASVGVGGEFLVIKPNTLAVRKTYAISVDVTYKPANGSSIMTQKVSYYVKVMQGPSWGSCVIRHVKDDEYIFSCTSWKNIQYGKTRYEVQTLFYDVTYSMTEKGQRRQIYYGAKYEGDFRLPASSWPVYVHIDIINWQNAITHVCLFSTNVVRAAKFRNRTLLTDFDSVYTDCVGDYSHLRHLLLLGDQNLLLAFVNVKLDSLPKVYNIKKLVSSYPEKKAQVEMVVKGLTKAFASLQPSCVVKVEAVSFTMSHMLHWGEYMGIDEIRVAAESTVKYFEYLYKKRNYQIWKNLNFGKVTKWQLLARELEMESWADSIIHTTLQNIAQLSLLIRHIKANQTSIDEKKFSSAVRKMAEIEKQLKDFFLYSVKTKLSFYGPVNYTFNDITLYGIEAQNSSLVESKETDFVAIIPHQLLSSNNRTNYITALLYLKDYPFIPSHFSVFLDKTAVSLWLSKDENTDVNIQEYNETVTIHLPSRNFEATETAKFSFHVVKEKISVHKFSVLSLNNTLHIDLRVENIKNRPFTIAAILSSEEISSNTPLNQSYVIAWKSVPSRRRSFSDDNIDHVKYTFEPNTLPHQGLYYFTLMSLDGMTEMEQRRRSSHGNVSYNVDIWWSDCYFWDVAQNNWSKNGIKTLNSSSLRQTRCSTSHLSTFTSSFVKITPEDFQTKIDFTSSSRAVLPIVSVVMIFLLFVFFCSIFIHLYVLRHRNPGEFDWNDYSDVDSKNPYNFGDWLRWRFGTNRKNFDDNIPLKLRDNKSNHDQVFEIKVQTGNWPGSGTSSQTYLKIFGEGGMYEARELKDHLSQKSKYYKKDQKRNYRCFFETGSTKTFVATFDENLGPLWKISIWHDHTGIQPRWYLEHVIIRDVTSDEKWFFPCGTWLALDKGLKRICVDLYPMERKPSLLKHIATRIRNYMFNYHSLLSVFAHPRWSLITRWQRIIHLLTLSYVVLALATAKLYLITNDYFRNDLTLLNDLTTAWEVVLGLLAFLLLLPAQLILRCSKQDERISVTIEDKTGNNENSSEPNLPSASKKTHFSEGFYNAREGHSEIHLPNPSTAIPYDLEMARSHFTPLPSHDVTLKSEAMSFDSVCLDDNINFANDHYDDMDMAESHRCVFNEEVLNDTDEESCAFTESEQFHLAMDGPLLVPCERLDPLPNMSSSLLPYRCRYIALFYYAAIFALSAGAIVQGVSDALQDVDLCVWLETCLFVGFWTVVVIEPFFLIVLGIFTTLLNLVKNSSISDTLEDLFLSADTIVPVDDHEYKYQDHSEQIETNCEEQDKFSGLNLSEIHLRVLEKRRSRYLKHMSSPYDNKGRWKDKHHPLRTRARELRKFSMARLACSTWLSFSFLLLTFIVIVYVLMHDTSERQFQSTQLQSLFKHGFHVDKYSVMLPRSRNAISNYSTLNQTFHFSNWKEWFESTFIQHHGANNSNLCSRNNFMLSSLTVTTFRRAAKNQCFATTPAMKKVLKSLDYCNETLSSVDNNFIFKPITMHDNLEYYEKQKEEFDLSSRNKHQYSALFSNTSAEAVLLQFVTYNKATKMYSVCSFFSVFSYHWKHHALSIRSTTLGFGNVFNYELLALLHVFLLVWVTQRSLKAIFSIIESISVCKSSKPKQKKNCSPTGISTTLWIDLGMWLVIVLYLFSVVGLRYCSFHAATALEMSGHLLSNPGKVIESVLQEEHTIRYILSFWTLLLVSKWLNIISVYHGFSSSFTRGLKSVYAFVTNVCFSVFLFYALIIMAFAIYGSLIFTNLFYRNSSFMENILNAVFHLFSSTRKQSMSNFNNNNQRSDLYLRYIYFIGLFVIGRVVLKAFIVANHQWFYQISKSVDQVQLHRRGCKANLSKCKNKVNMKNVNISERKSKEITKRCRGCLLKPFLSASSKHRYVCLKDLWNANITEAKIFFNFLLCKSCKNLSLGTFGTSFAWDFLSSKDDLSNSSFMRYDKRKLPDEKELSKSELSSSVFQTPDKAIDDMEEYTLTGEVALSEVELQVNKLSQKVDTFLDDYNDSYDFSPLYQNLHLNDQLLEESFDEKSVLKSNGQTCNKTAIDDYGLLYTRSNSIAWEMQRVLSEPAYPMHARSCMWNMSCNAEEKKGFSLDTNFSKNMNNQKVPLSNLTTLNIARHNGRLHRKTGPYKKIVTADFSTKNVSNFPNEIHEQQKIGDKNSSDGQSKRLKTFSKLNKLVNKRRNERVVSISDSKSSQTLRRTHNTFIDPKDILTAQVNSSSSENCSKESMLEDSSPSTVRFQQSNNSVDASSSFNEKYLNIPGYIPDSTEDD